MFNQSSYKIWQQYIHFLKQKNYVELYGKLCCEYRTVLIHGKNYV
jgi:hypothetical protein